MMPPAKFGDAPSRRESQVAIAILFGRSRMQTADDLRLSYKTVDQYRYRLFAKYGVHNCFELVRVLMRGAPDQPRSPS